MSRVRDILLDDARAAFLRVAHQAKGRKDTVEAAVLWLLPSPNARETIAPMAEFAAGCKGQMRSYKQVAILGFASDLMAEEFDHQSALESALMWLSGVPPISAGALMGFTTDPVALFGVALGTRHVTTSVRRAVRNWAVQFLADSYRASSAEPWYQCLLVAASLLLEGMSEIPIPTAYAGACSRVVMRSKGLLPAVSPQDLDTDEEQVLTLLKYNQDVAECTHAALLVAALDWIRRQAPTVIPERVTPDDVVVLLKRIEFAMKRWTWENAPRTRNGTAQKWHVDNEYHVQNLLWVILAPIFPDLTDELSTVQLGSKNPRADFGIKSLSLIIEAKFMRPKDNTAKMISELGEDASLYLVAGSSFNQIVAVIWDDAARTNQHDEMIRSMKQIDGILDVVVVSRPGDWK